MKPVSWQRALGSSTCFSASFQMVYRYTLFCGSWSESAFSLLLEPLEKGLPAVSNHAHAFGFGLAIELCAFLEVLLTSNPLGIAESCLSKSIHIPPRCSNDRQY